MKTIQISENDELELKILADRMEREHDNARRTSAHKAENYGCRTAGPVTSDNERESRKAVETLRRVLKTAKASS